jgi:hypothetical protein
MSFQGGGCFYLDRLCRAIGIDPKATPVKRIVIDANVNNAVMVYVQMYLDEQPGREAVPDVLADAVRSEAVTIQQVKRIDVDDTGNVQMEEIDAGNGRLYNRKALLEAAANYDPTYNCRCSQLPLESGLDPEAEQKSKEAEFFKNPIKRD